MDAVNVIQDLGWSSEMIDIVFSRGGKLRYIIQGKIENYDKLLKSLPKENSVDFDNNIKTYKLIRGEKINNKIVVYYELLRNS